MSWPERGRARRAAAVVLLTASTAAVAGCGFRPLHGTAWSEDGAGPGFAQTRIAPLSGPSGQKLHNLLRDRINPSGQPAAPRYVLSVSLDTKISKLGIRKDETATRANLVVRARYALRTQDTNSPLFQARSESVNSYNILDDFYATSVSRESATERGLREVADEISRRLGIYFSGGTASAQP